MRWLDSITGSVDMNLSKLQGAAEDGGAWHATIHGVAKKFAWNPRLSLYSALSVNAFKMTTVHFYARHIIHSMHIVFFFSTSYGMWDLSFLTKDRACAPCHKSIES